MEGYKQPTSAKLEAGERKKKKIRNLLLFNKIRAGEILETTGF